MSERKINLEEILARWISKNLQEHGRSREASDAVAKTSIKDGSYWYILEAMKEFGKQLLELAAENADVKAISEMISISNGADFNIQKMVVDKQSILNTIKQVE